MEKGTQYRTLLIQAIHACATKFADVAERCAHAKRGHCYVFVFSFPCAVQGRFSRDNCHSSSSSSRWHTGPRCADGCWCHRGVVAVVLDWRTASLLQGFDHV